MGKTALITGASSGIGEDLAKIHAATGGDLVIVARRKEKLDKLKTQLEKQHGINITVIAKDLATDGAGKSLYEDIKTLGLNVTYLINNAGFGGFGKFHERDWEKDKAMIQLNIMTLTELTRYFLDDMVKKNEGRILNVASMAGFLPGPLQAVYYATKAYVLSFSEAIQNELSETSITVTALCPGATETEFAKTGNLEKSKLFQNAMDSYKVAKSGYSGMLSGKSVIIPGTINNLTIQSLRMAPRDLATKISRKLMEA